MFAHQLGRNVQVYVDDMLVKSVHENDHLNDLQETFNTLRSYNMKLNPSKFLGFMVSQRGIEVNLEGHIRARTPEDNESNAELEWKSCGLEQVRL